MYARRGVLHYTVLNSGTSFCTVAIGRRVGFRPLVNDKTGGDDDSLAEDEKGRVSQSYGALAFTSFDSCSIQGQVFGSVRFLSRNPNVCNGYGPEERNTKRRVKKRERGRKRPRDGAKEDQERGWTSTNAPCVLSFPLVLGFLLDAARVRTFRPPIGSIGELARRGGGAEEERGALRSG